MPGVVGVAAGFRERSGRRRPEVVITVFVEPGVKERNPARVRPRNRIPERLTVTYRGRRTSIATDLVATAVGRLQAADPGPFGQGTQTANAASRPNRGTLGWVGRWREHDLTIVTASFHVALRFGRSRTTGDRVKRYELETAPDEFMIHPDLPDAPFGFVIKGCRNAFCDAVLVQAFDDAPLLEWHRRRGIREPRELEPADTSFERVTAVVVWVHDGPPLQGVITRYPAFFKFRYPDFPSGLILGDLIETNVVTRPGDSGALLTDAQGAALGLLVGLGDGRSYFMSFRSLRDNLNVV
jgi:hypothetical protein